VDTTLTGVRPAASVYAVVRSDWACSATASATCWVPLITSPGGKPVTELPGLTPKSPDMTEAPVFVTVVPANTAKGVAVPKPTGGWAAEAVGVATNPLEIAKVAVITAATYQWRKEPAHLQPIVDLMNFRLPPNPTSQRLAERVSPNVDRNYNTCN
jgi:hypothetical protein